MSRKVDLWYGYEGSALRVQGELLSETPDETGYYNVRITDKEFLEDIGFDEPWDVVAKILPNNYHVRYDDYCWSELGKIQDSQLDENGQLWEINEPKDFTLKINSLEDLFEITKLLR